MDKDHSLAGLVPFSWSNTDYKTATISFFIGRHLRMSRRSSILIVFLLTLCFEFFEGHLDSFPHKELDKLFLADIAVSVDVYLTEDMTDGLLRLLAF